MIECRDMEAISYENSYDDLRGGSFGDSCDGSRSGLFDERVSFNGR